jgi:hypothetical protein
MASRRALWKAGAWRVRRLSSASELSGPTPDRESRFGRIYSHARPHVRPDPERARGAAWLSAVAAIGAGSPVPRCRSPIACRSGRPRAPSAPREGVTNGAGIRGARRCL